VVDAFAVIINGVKLRAKRGRYGLWSMAQLENEFPLWMLDTENTPLRAVYSNGILYLHPFPTAAVIAAGQCYVPSTVFPLDRTADNDPDTGLSSQLDLLDELHEAACFLAAVKGGKPQVEGNEAIRRLQDYSAEWFGIAQELRAVNSADLVEWTQQGSENYEYRGEAAWDW
jgi:hypothetical protein